MTQLGRSGTKYAKAPLEDTLIDGVRSLAKTAENNIVCTTDEQRIVDAYGVRWHAEASRLFCRRQKTLG
jgi:hypothetical protein